MKSCRSCKTTVDENLTSCPECGRTVVSDASNGVKERVRELLARANVQRIQHDYDGAIATCTEALELDSENPEICSLLGDIYCSCGKPAEAIRWYELAIDMRPSCAMDVSKLEKTKALINADSSNEDIETDWSDIQQGGRMEGIVRWLVIVCVACVLAILVVGVRVYIADRKAMELPVTSTPAPVNTDTPPETHSDESGMIPSLPEGVYVRPSLEQDMLTALATNEKITGGRLIVEDVRMDPRKRSAVITFWNAQPPSKVDRKRMVSDAALVAVAAFRQRQELVTVTARMIVHKSTSTGFPDPALALVCDFARPKDIDKQEIETAVRKMVQESANQWWNPDLPK